MIEVQFEYGSMRGGRSFDTREEAEEAIRRMREAGVTVIRVHTAPSYPWPDAPKAEDE